MMNLNAKIDFDLKHFFLWWGRELSFLVPEKLRELLSDKSGYVFISATTESILLSRMIDGQQQTISELALNESSLEQYQQLIGDDAELEKANYILRLTSDQAIKKILYLPAVAKENLRQVIAFEINKYTPFKEEQVYFAVKSLGKEENGQIKVLLVLTPKKILDTIYQQLKNVQIYSVITDYERAANNFADDLDIYNLLPEQKKQIKNKITQGLIWFFSSMLLVLTIAVLVFLVWHQRQSVESLRQQLKQLEKDAHFVQSQQLEIDNIVDETEHLIKFKNSSPSLLEIINLLSQLIQDDTWLTHFKYNDTRLQIQGQSPTASALIGMLESSSLFSNARFVSPLTQDKKTGLERFQISVDVNALGVDGNE